jgi:hypothetical protein
MYIGIGVFAVLAIIVVLAGTDADGDGEMGEAEFRKYEGFDD